MFSSGDAETAKEDRWSTSGQQQFHAFSKKFLSSSNVMRSGSRPIRRASYSISKQLIHSAVNSSLSMARLPLRRCLEG